MNTNDHILENDKIKKRFSMLPQCGMNFKASQTLPPFETVITVGSVCMGQCEHTTVRIPKTFQINFSGVLCNTIGCVYTVYNFRKT